MVSAQLLEKDRAKIPKKVPFFFIYRGILLYNVRIVQWGTKGMEAGILSASGFTHFSLLRQIPPCILAESAFPTPLPPPSWRARWKGDWWVVPAGMMTSSSSCLQWGPLTPA